MQRIKQLKDQLMGQQQPEQMISPVPPPESQDDQYATMVEKMRAVRGGELPDQETVQMMKKQQEHGVYNDGNPYLGIPMKESMQPEVQGTMTEQPSIQQPTPTPTPMPRQTTVFQKPKNSEMGFIRPEHQKFLEKNVFPITDEAGLPRDLVAGQWAGEGGRKTENPNNNLFGIGPHMKFKDLPSNVNTYVSTVKKLLSQRGIDDASGLTGEQILAIIQNNKGQRYEGHNKDPMEYTRFIPSIPEFRYYRNNR